METTPASIENPVALVPHYNKYPTGVCRQCQAQVDIYHSGNCHRCTWGKKRTHWAVYGLLVLTMFLIASVAANVMQLKTTADLQAMIHKQQEFIREQTFGQFSIPIPEELRKEFSKLPHEQQMEHLRKLEDSMTFARVQRRLEERVRELQVQVQRKKLQHEFLGPFVDPIP